MFVVDSLCPKTFMCDVLWYQGDPALFIRAVNCCRYIGSSRKTNGLPEPCRQRVKPDHSCRLWSADFIVFRPLRRSNQESAASKYSFSLSLQLGIQWRDKKKLTKKRVERGNCESVSLYREINDNVCRDHEPVNECRESHKPANVERGNVCCFLSLFWPNLGGEK
jgi:hypothetical protein